MPIRQSDPTTNSLLIRATRIDPYASLFDGTESSATCQRLQAGVPISAWVGYCNTELRLFERLSGFCRDKNDWLSNGNMISNAYLIADKPVSGFSTPAGRPRDRRPSGRAWATCRTVQWRLLTGN